MPGPISDSHKGTPAHAPYVPSWCYENNAPPMCGCGCHHGYHDDDGECLNKNHWKHCGCSGYDGSEPYDGHPA